MVNIHFHLAHMFHKYPENKSLFMESSELFFVDDYKHRLRKSTRERHEPRHHRRIPHALRHGKCDDCDQMAECKLIGQGWTDICHKVTADTAMKQSVMNPLFAA